MTAERQRWDRSQVRQHQLLVVSVLALCLTGLPLRYAATPTGGRLIRWIGGATVAGWGHRIAGAALLVCLFWHIGYLAKRWRSGTFRASTLPAVKDVTDAWGLGLYLLRLRPDPPRFGRYSFLEKFDYWAAVGGSVVMIATGLALWFPVLAARVVGGVGVELAGVVHSLEAVLAATFLLIGHVYHVHVAHGVMPFNRVWLTGRITEEAFRRDHPLEYEREGPGASDD